MERHRGLICSTTLEKKKNTQTSSHLRGTNFICLKPQRISLERISCSPGSFKDMSVFQQIMFLTHCKAMENVFFFLFLKLRSTQFIYLLSLTDFEGFIPAVQYDGASRRCQHLHYNHDGRFSVCVCVLRVVSRLASRWRHYHRSTRAASRCRSQWRPGENAMWCWGAGGGGRERDVRCVCVCGGGMA